MPHGLHCYTAGLVTLFIHFLQPAECNVDFCVPRIVTLFQGQFKSLGCALCLLVHGMHVLYCMVMLLWLA